MQYVAYASFHKLNISYNEDHHPIDYSIHPICKVPTANPPHIRTIRNGSRMHSSTSTTAIVWLAMGHTNRQKKPLPDHKRRAQLCSRLGTLSVYGCPNFTERRTIGNGQRRTEQMPCEPSIHTHKIRATYDKHPHTENPSHVVWTFFGRNMRTDKKQKHSQMSSLFARTLWWWFGSC